jgi:hypothetical protein
VKHLLKWLTGHPITTQDEARAFMRDVLRDGCVWHPDDDADQIVDRVTGEPAFTAYQQSYLNRKWDEVFTVFDGDPYEASMEETYDEKGQLREYPEGDA